MIGDGCTIEDHAVLGKRPRLATHSGAAGEVGALELAREVTVGAGAIVFAGAPVGDERDPRRPVLRARALARSAPARVIGRGSVVDNDVSSARACVCRATST